MKCNILFRLFLLIAFTCILNDTFARGGGGHGGGGVHGGHGGGRGGSHGSGHGLSYGGGKYYHNVTDNGINILEAFIVILFAVAAVVGGTIPALLKLKSNFAVKVLTHASNRDTLWDAHDLKVHARRTFYRMQEAWQNQNIDEVKNLLTPNLTENYKRMLIDMLARDEKNMLSRIDITETTIIGCEDYKDDSKDRYIAYIKGTMLDYVIHEPSRKIVLNPEKIIGSFADTYHFVRMDTKWLLEKIDNTVTMHDIIKAKNYIEK